MGTRKKSGRPILQRSKEDILALMAEYEKEKSAMSIPEFCKVHAIGKSTFYTWQRKYGAGYQVKPRGRFIELRAPGQVSASKAGGQVFAVVRSSGLEVEIHQVVEPGYLKALLS
jgi:hypothetical protein